MKKSSIKFFLEEGSYGFPKAETEEMWILGHFLSSDVGCYWNVFKDFAVEEFVYECSGNSTYLEKERDFILVSDVTSKMPYPYLKVPKQEFIRLLDEWEKICKQKPSEVLISFDWERFTIETKQ